MSGLVACPFCRSMFQAKEAASCPECGLRLQALSSLPPSTDALADDPDEPLPPHMETLPWTFPGRGRAALLVFALMGLAAFFSPWICEPAPEICHMRGFEFAQTLGWLWAPAVAWFVMIPLGLSRRSIYKMRGARVAVGFLAGIVLTTVGVRIGFTPRSSPLRPVHFEWAWGLYASGLLGLAALAAS